jgi:16S rRNA (guanine527-N7)-methyltransferase
MIDFQSIIGRPLTDTEEGLLNRYHDILMKWQSSINLIAPSTTDKIWQRHFADSAQLLAHLNVSRESILTDMGSGAGFPGLILAVLSPAKIHLIESDQRKATFLRQVVRELSLERVTIHADRIEKISPISGDIVTARALADLDQLVEWAIPHGDVGYFMKGETVGEEVAKSNFSNLIQQKIPSKTEDGAEILKLDLSLSH